MLHDTPAITTPPKWPSSPSLKPGSINHPDRSSNIRILLLIALITALTISSTIFTKMFSFFSPTAIGTIWPHLLLPLTQIFALALPPFPHRTTIFVPLIFGLVLLTWRNLCTDVVELRALIIGQWPWYLGTLTKLLFYEPERDFWRADRQRGEALRMGGLSAEKWRWAAALYCSPRLVGWNEQVKGIPVSKVAGSKREFVVERLKLLGLCFVVIDLNNLYNHTYYYRPNINPMTLSVRGPSLSRSLLNYILGFAGVLCNFTWLYNQIAIISVLLGGGAPKDWPHLYGPISSSYTLRLYWNTFWHQTIRHPLTSASLGFKRHFGIPRGTWLSSYTEVWVCFTLSAMFHGICTLALPVPVEDGRSDWGTRFGGWFMFMFVQSAGIMVEDGVIWAWRQFVGGESKVSGAEEVKMNGVGEWKEKGSVVGKDADAPVWQKAVGFVWVYVFWYWIDPWTVDPLLRLGVIAGDPLPFSIVGPVLEVTGMRGVVEKLILG